MNEVAAGTERSARTEGEDEAPAPDGSEALLRASYARLAEAARAIGEAQRAYVIRLDDDGPTVLAAAGATRPHAHEEGPAVSLIATALEVRRAVLSPSAPSVLCAPLVEAGAPTKGGGAEGPVSGAPTKGGGAEGPVARAPTKGGGAEGPAESRCAIYLERDEPFSPAALPRIEALASYAAGALASARRCALLTAVGDNSPAVIFVKDCAGRYVYVNRQYERRYHVAGDAIVGERDHALFVRERADAYRAADLQALAGDRVELRYTVPLADGMHDFEVLEFPLHDERGRIWAVGGIAYDVTARRRAEEALRHSVSLLEAALESTADGLLVVDRRGRMARVNRRFATLWRIPDEVLVTCDDKRALDSVLDQLIDPDEFLRKVGELYANPEASSFDRLRFKDGRVFERYSQPQRLGDEIVGRVWSFRDVTARVRAEEQRDRLLAAERRARGEAEAAVRLRDEFLSVASHELRTPVMSLQLALRLIRDRFAPIDAPELRRVTDIAQRQVRRLGTLVGLLLDVARLRGGRLELNPSEVDLAQLVRDRAALLADEIARNGSTLRVRVDEPLKGRWDALRLEQAVTHLLSNASKFGQGRPIDLEARREGDTAIVSVRDRGLGIPVEMQAQLGQPYQRLVSSRHYGGLGLGLFITRTIVEAHGGRLRVFSEPGKGSTFTLELPLAGCDGPR